MITVRLFANRLSPVWVNYSFKKAHSAEKGRAEQLLKRILYFIYWFFINEYSTVKELGLYKKMPCELRNN